VSPSRYRRRSPTQSRSPRREKKKRESKVDSEADKEKQREREYKKSLWPPGSDLSLYTYDPALYWHVTTDKVWWYRPDLTLWYDSRSGAYFSYDSAISDYVAIETDVATHALAHGLNVSPEAVYERQKKADQEATNAALLASQVAVLPSVPETVDTAVPQSDARTMEELGSPAAAQQNEASLPRNDEAEDAQEHIVDAEDMVAMQIRAHTESWQGKKDTQEDRYFQHVRMGKLGTAFGVFDGHGGVQSAEYAVKHLPNNIIRCFQKHAASTRRDSGLDTKRLLGAMEEAFPLTDAELLHFARRKGFKDGTTALFLLIAGTELDNLTLFTAHVGDCRAVLCRGGHAVRLTQDHRPDRKDEQKRIKDAGGGVFQVSGIWRCTTGWGAARALDARTAFKESDNHLYLSCSRTFGDPDLKANADRPILSNQPDLGCQRLTADDLFVVLACDGVWDVLDDQTVVDIVLEHWGDPAAAASSVVRKALSTGSGDNLTAQVVTFGWKNSLGTEIAMARAEQKQQALAEADKPKEKVVVDEGDLDMFS